MKHTLETLKTRIIRTPVDWSCAGLPLVDFLTGRFTYRNKDEWCARIISGEITLNGREVPPETVLNLHDIIEYRPGDIVEPAADLNYRIIHEDENILVIDKPGNLCMHPAGPFFKHTLWHLLCSRFGQIHFINRLDRETSGLLLAAKNSAAAKKFAQGRNVNVKNYQVIVHGDFPETLHASGFLYRAGGMIRKKRSFSFTVPETAESESAETFFKCLKRSSGFSLLQAELATGRMHQIRATLCSLGYPVAGDKLYGTDEKFYLKQRSDELSEADRKKLIFSRQALHSCELEYIDPADGALRHFESSLPTELAVFTDNMM